LEKFPKRLNFYFFSPIFDTLTGVLIILTNIRTIPTIVLVILTNLRKVLTI